jgi:hypothetical protein
MATLWDARTAGQVLIDVAVQHGIDGDELVEALGEGPAPVFRPALRLAGGR